MSSNKLFWDLDETLVHSMYANNEEHADQLIDMYGEHWKGVKFEIRHDGWFVSFLRNSTQRLLEFSRELLGKENVYILSAGSCDYVLWANTKIELGFDPNTNIFTREDFTYTETSPKFKDTFNVLIDNENYFYHALGERGKVKFLNNYPIEQHINIEPFTVWSEKIDPDWVDNYVEDTKERIRKAFNLC